MKRALVTAALLIATSVPVTGAAASSPQPPGADVEAVATVMLGFLVTNFEFNVHNCPEGAEMAVLFWEAEQPDRPPGSGVSSGTQPFGPSTGDRVQHLTLSAGGNFIAGERWVGSGLVECGPFVIPVEGSGTTHSQTGV